MKTERKYLDLELQYSAMHLKRIIYNKKESVGTTEVHMGLMDLMKHILLYSANIAKTYIGSTHKKEDEYLHITDVKSKIEKKRAVK